MEERKLQTKKILERMKQDENMRSFEGEDRFSLNLISSHSTIGPK